MDDHVTKPIDPDELWRVVAKWVGGEEAASNAPPVVVVDPGDTLPPLLPGLNLAVALSRLRGRVASLRKLLAGFAENQAQAVPAIRGEWAEGNHDTAARLAHTLKGLAGTIGAEELQAAAKAVEMACCNEPRPGDITDLLATLDDRLQQVTASIATLEIEADPAPGTSATQPALDPQEMTTRLDALGEALDDGDAAAGDQLAELLDHELPESVLSGLRDIKQHVAAYAFEEALDALTAMRSAMNGEKEKDADA